MVARIVVLTRTDGDAPDDERFSETVRRTHGFLLGASTSSQRNQGRIVKRPYCRKWRSKEAACVMPSLSMTAKLSASQSE